MTKSTQLLGEIKQKRAEYVRSRRVAYKRYKHFLVHSRVPAGQYDWRVQKLIVNVPEVLDLEENRAATLEVARACRTNCFVHKQQTLLDFRGTKSISSSAILYLVAEIDRCRKLSGVRMLDGTYPKDTRLKRQMRDAGFYDALGVRCEMSERPKVFPLEYIKVRSGTLADGRLARELRVALLGPHAEQIEREKSKSFFRAMTEAMTNVVHHAYPADWNNGPVRLIDKGWWMLGHINRLSKNLKIMIVDQGIGIPRSLPRKHAEVLRSLFTKLGLAQEDDGNMIHAAMELGRSRLEQSHRGKGLNDLKQIINICNAGTLRILSKKGEYRYRIRGGKVEERALTHDESLNGTLVEWIIPLNAILPLLSIEEASEET